MSEMQVVIRIRPIDVAAVVSVLLHAALFLFTKIHVPEAPEGPITDQPLNVVLAPPQAQVTIPEAPPAPQSAPAPPTPQILARKPAPQAPKSPAPVVPPVVATVPTPPTPREPLVDMLAAIQSNRAERAAAESALARGAPSEGKEDAAERNVRSLSGREGVGGVFQVLRKGLRSGEFAFNGFRNSGQRRWREVIEVDAGPGGDIELAMVRRMIELIRTHYTGDFRWESHRIDRVVVLSARPADQPGLEEFLLREFFASPPPPPPASARAGRSPPR